ncbi:isoleucine--tRNA ligase [Spiroplasma endosymbiont of Dilophus febrilis]|uniref:isoleucine--tRNA ligase n=1 Tax=Spiroplasma endosymbiont of Dilophus febrilis TaxID=3066292 RepID=UPI00313B4262
MRDWKSTLLMPQTMFEMRANLKDKELHYQQKWQKEQLWSQILLKNEFGKKFILHDGPPYANGSIHVGHALNKILKDIIVRNRSFNGYYAPLLFGWDTHGLPIETAVTKLNIEWKKSDPVLFRNKCYEYAQEQIAIQKQQFARLGLLNIPNDEYITCVPTYEGYQIDFLIMMIEQKLIYRGLKPVYWSPSSQTALAEAEVEYMEKTSPSIFIACDLKAGNGVLDNDVRLVVWTTTPWTLTSNQFIAVGKDIEYVVINSNQGKLVVAKELLAKVSEQCQLLDVKVIKQLIGANLVGITYFHPLYSNIINKVVLGHHITLTEGTALVHTACGFGVDDFIIGQQNNTAPIVSVDDAGYFTDIINDEQLYGKFYEDTNKIITTRLKADNRLLALSFIKHSYPHDWRTKKPIIYRATEQWFVAISAIKSQLLEQINQVKYLPVWGQERMRQMIMHRDDWCISRQRLWGVPITILYGEDNEPIYDVALIKHFRDLIAQYGTAIWWSWSLDKLLPKNYVHHQAPNGKFRKETDIMDVWFDSGISHWNLWQQKHWKYPVDLYLEGSDQFRGWFNSSLTTGVISPLKRAPYEQVIIHGFINDEKGKKMSKSLGNVVDPLEVCNTYGSDILRLWVSSVDYTDEMKIGNDILKQVSETYRKIRNTMRFMLGNLFDFKLEHIVKEYEIVDQYLLVKTQEYHQATQVAYNNYDFNEVYVLTNNFIVNSLSAFYLDFTKDILYIEEANSMRRKQVQTTIYYILQTLLFNLAPILVHTCEEVYEYLPLTNKLSSIHLMDMVVLPTFENIKEIKNIGYKLLQLREDVNKALELARNERIIGKSLQAQVIMELNDNYQELATINNLGQMFIISELIVTNNLSEGVQYPTAKIAVKLKLGDKCVRCWMIVSVTMDELCSRCQKVISKLEENK